MSRDEFSLSAATAAGAAVLPLPNPTDSELGSMNFRVLCQTAFRLLRSVDRVAFVGSALSFG